MTRPVTVALLGSTGSIGTQAIDVLRGQQDAYRVVALGAARSVDELLRQADELRPDIVAIADEDAAKGVAERLPSGTQLLVGAEALATAATTADVVLNAVVGFAGLGVTLSAIAAERRLALANKESLIAAGPVVQAALAKHPAAELVPVDSEHSAIHQCLRSCDARREVARILLTASGGPFRGRSRKELEGVSIDDALTHPTWKMGPKITVDASTLMNKGLEVIEAHELFGLDYDHIEVVVHPQSIVHSMVEFQDGSTVAQLSRPDMRLPIGYALAWPCRLPQPFGRIDWATLARLDFESPDLEAFPCLGLAFDAGRVGGTAPAWLSAANEVAVEAFLAGSISWLSIPDVLKGVLARHDGGRAITAADIIEADARARTLARGELQRYVY
jgi:1-deoxy-D-xylulose-5-phosphate reductoisomerase